MFSADAPFKQHFLDAHGLDDDPGTETRLPDDPEPEPDPEPEAAAPKRRRMWGGGRGTDPEPSKVPDDVPLVDAEPEPQDFPAAVDDAPVEVAVAPDRHDDEDIAEHQDVLVVPEPVIVPSPPPDGDDEDSAPPRALRLVAVAGIAFVVVVFVLAAVRLTGSDASPRGAHDAGGAAVVTAPPPAAPTALPPAAGEQYVVARGDSLSKIANRLGVSVEALVAANGIPDRNLIFPGQVLTVPR